MDEAPVVAAEVLSRDHDGSRASECHFPGMMSWQQALPTYHGILAPRLNPTSSGWLQPGWPTFSAQPVRVEVEVETVQQEREAGMEQAKVQVVAWVAQLVQEILQQGQVRVQG